MRFIIEKGSITIDGISLTVAREDKDSFQVSIIPHTAAKTILSEKKNGDMVNLENDCVGKYVAKAFAALSGKQERRSSLRRQQRHSVHIPHHPG